MNTTVSITPLTQSTSSTQVVEKAESMSITPTTFSTLEQKINTLTIPRLTNLRKLVKSLSPINSPVEILKNGLIQSQRDLDRIASQAHALSTPGTVREGKTLRAWQDLANALRHTDYSQCSDIAKSIYTQIIKLNDQSPPQGLTKAQLHTIQAFSLWGNAKIESRREQRTEALTLALQALKKLSPSETEQRQRLETWIADIPLTENDIPQLLEKGKALQLSKDLFIGAGLILSHRKLGENHSISQTKSIRWMQLANKIKLNFSCA